MASNKKFFFYSAVLFVGYICLMIILPSTILSSLWAVIAGWQIGGWVYQLARKWSDQDDTVQS
jgi:hypothetical protein